MTDDIKAVRKSYFANPPYRATTFGTGCSAVMSALGVNCAIFNEHGRTLTDQKSAMIIAEMWNNEH
jgi:hypothetical protein